MRGILVAMSEKGKGMALHNKILVGLFLGAIAGLAANIIGPSAGWQSLVNGTPGWIQTPLTWMYVNLIPFVGDAFLAMIYMIVVPLLFSALILGVSELGDVAKVGRIGVRSLLLTLLFSGIAVVIAFALVNAVKPGTFISQESREVLYEQYATKGTEKQAAADVKIPDPPAGGIIPKNPLLEATRALSGGIMPFMFFALLFGLAMCKSDTEKVAPVKQFFDGIFEISQKVIDIAMLLAPYAVFALIFQTAAGLGIEIFKTLGAYAIVVLVGLAIHMFVVYSILVKVIAKRNPLTFFRNIRSVMLTAFATSSSNATLPIALKSAEEDLGLPKEISSFVLTVGATANQNGTALFEGITLIFFCQLFGIPLDASQQFMLLMLSILAGIGTAGVPGGSWPVIGSILTTMKVPAGAIGIAFGVDRILDMSRTVLNVTGDIAIAACVAEWEGQSVEIPDEVLA